QWIDFDSIESAKQEITKLINEDEDCRILKDCMLCFSCDEYCPYNSHPFDKINELQEKYLSQDIQPAIVQNSIDTYKAKREFVPRPIDPEKPILNKCAFPKTNAKQMKGPMFDDLQSVFSFSHNWVLDQLLYLIPLNLALVVLHNKYSFFPPKGTVNRELLREYFYDT
ncbi:unnamed protein product, partial [marine sediment metagenome]